MFQPGQIQSYDALNESLDHLLTGEDDVISHLANAGSLLNYYLDDVNWVGFYIMKNNHLQLGPFQGLPACVTIPLGRGVCGTAASEDKTMRIDDVHQFPGHIACDANSKSEIVIPVHVNGEIFGVLDIDAPIHNRFTEEDETGLTTFVAVLEKHLAAAQ